jgi:hypothetical protein
MALLASSTFAAQAQKTADDDADLKELAAYSLSMEKIRNLVTTTKELKEWEQQNPDLAKGMDDSAFKNAASISEQAKVFDSKLPQASAIIKKNSFSTREYLVALYAFIQAEMVVSLKKAGQAPDNDKLSGAVNPANLELIEQNWDEVEKLKASIGSPAEKP